MSRNYIRNRRPFLIFLLKLNRNDNTPFISSNFRCGRFFNRKFHQFYIAAEKFPFFFKISSRIDCKQINLPLTSISTTEITIEQTRCFSMHNQYRCNFRFFTFQQTFNQLFNPFNPHSFFFSQLFKAYSCSQFSHPFIKIIGHLSVQFIVFSHIILPYTLSPSK